MARSIPENVRAARLEIAELSIAEVAAMLDWDRSKVRRHETQPVDKLSGYQELADLYGLSLSELLGGNQPNEDPQFEQFLTAHFSPRKRARIRQFIGEVLREGL